MKTLAIIINFRSFLLTLQAVRSVLESQSLGSVTVVVVDNSGLPEEAERLRLNLPSSVFLRVNAKNVGFGLRATTPLRNLPETESFSLTRMRDCCPAAWSSCKEPFFSTEMLRLSLLSFFGTTTRPSICRPHILQPFLNSGRYCFPGVHMPGLIELSVSCGGDGPLTYGGRGIRFRLAIFREDWYFWIVRLFKGQGGFLIPDFFSILKTRIFFCD